MNYNRKIKCLSNVINWKKNPYIFTLLFPNHEVFTSIELILFINKNKENNIH